MLTGAAANASPAGELTRGAVARVYGVSQTKLRLILPDGASGYVDAAATTPAAAPVRRERLRADAVLREQPVPIAPVVEVLASGTAVEVLGQFGVYELLQIPDGISGWVEKLR
jgi:predicted kinase